MALITGNTFRVKEALKALGGRWNAQAKGWDVPDAKADEAHALVDGATPGPGCWVPKTCKTCGCRIRYGTFCGTCEFAY